MNVELEINTGDRELTWGELRAFVALGRHEPDDAIVPVREEATSVGRGLLVSLVLIDVDDHLELTATAPTTTEGDRA